MNYRRVGNSGLKLSKIALGSWLTAGNAVDDETAMACVRRAVELGVNYFDSADVYAERRAEAVTGKALAPFRREDYVLASKCFFPASDNVLDRGLSRQHVFASVHKSLRQLNTDYIDLFYCHRHDEETPVAETVRAFEDLIRAGKVLYWGVSEWSAKQIEEACAVAGKLNAYAPVINQPCYNLINRTLETNGVMATCAKQGMGIAAFSPLSQGLLTGKYRGDKRPTGSRLADKRQNQFIGDLATDENMRRVDRIAPIAEQAGLSMAALALAWCLRRRELTCAIVGASRVAQVEQNVAAAATKLSADTVAALEAL
ncbi:MAG: aldo/keto reductase family protein [Phycisphaerae bacterium]